MNIGDEVKIFLKGESPWGNIVEIEGEKIKVKITSKLIFEFSEHERAQIVNSTFGSGKALPRLHNRKKGDEVWCSRGKFNEWVDAEIN